MEFSDTCLEIGTFIRHVTWKHLYPIENLRRLMQSRKQVVVFLDENDSDFGAYVVEALRTDIDVLSYYAFFHHMKQRQHLLSQTLMSLLFLEAINIRTRKPFAEEVMVVSQPSRRLVKKFRISGRLGDVFEAFLLGSAVRRQISAKFLKCMKCDGSELKKIGMYKDLSDSRNLGLFFSDLIK
ncbi:hypothetical protein GTO27_05125, partial [Candidatus Bathyarchaeota archaeon]|nr:hypothetical protein [Candidatus Bathyarchaeota archaeon]